MTLTDSELGFFDTTVLRLSDAKRKEHMGQVGHLIERMETKIEEDTSFGVQKFYKTGSMEKRTALQPRDGFAVDADVAVYLDASEATPNDVDNLHSRLRNLLISIYPQKKPQDFTIQPKTLGIVFSTSGLNVDFVPILALDSKSDFGLQPASDGGSRIKTSVPGQLRFVASLVAGDARFRKLVRFAKRWRNENELEYLGSFAIELILGHIQQTQGAAPSLEEGLLRFFRWVYQSKLDTRIQFDSTPGQGTNDPVAIFDPVNNGNNVTRKISQSEKTELVSQARTGFETLTYARRKNFRGETVELWREIFGRGFRVE